MAKKFVMRGIKLSSLSIVLITLETICAAIVSVTLMNAGLPRNISISFVGVLLLVFSLLCLRVIPTHFLDLETESKDTLWKTSVDVIIALTQCFFKVHTQGTNQQKLPAENNQQKFIEQLDELIETICKSELTHEEVMERQAELIVSLMSIIDQNATQKKEEKKETLSQKDPDENTKGSFSKADPDGDQGCESREEQSAEKTLAPSC